MRNCLAGGAGIYRLHQRDYLDAHRSSQWLYDSGILGQTNTRQQSLATIALSQPGVLFTAAEVAERFSISENTARDDLKKLTALGLMQVMKERRGNVYLSPCNLQQLKKWHGKANAQPRTPSAQGW